MTASRHLQSIRELPGVRAGALLGADYRVLAEAPAGSGAGLARQIGRPPANVAVHRLDDRRTLVLELDESCTTRDAVLDVAAYLLTEFEEPAAPAGENDDGPRIAVGVLSPVGRAHLERRLRHRLGKTAEEALVRNLVHALDEGDGERQRKLLRRLAEGLAGEKALDLWADVHAICLETFAEHVKLERRAVEQLLHVLVSCLRRIGRSDGSSPVSTFAASVEALKTVAAEWSRSDSHSLSRQARTVGWVVDGFVELAAELSRLRQSAALAHRARKELGSAVEVQRLLFPIDAAIEDHAFSLSAVASPAGECSGDLWVIHRLGERKLFLLVGDVTGNGAGAAMVGAMARAVCDAIVGKEPTDVSGSRVLQAVDHVLYRACGGKLLLTAVAALFDFDARQLRIWNAGHPPVILLRPGRAPREIVASGPVLGAQGGGAFESHAVEFQGGDSFVFYTDGVIDARSDRGQRFGTRRFCQVLQEASRGTPAALCDAVRRALGDYATGTPPQDDWTLVVLRSNLNP